MNEPIRQEMTPGGIKLVLLSVLMIIGVVLMVIYDNGPRSTYRVPANVGDTWIWEDYQAAQSWVINNPHDVLCISKHPDGYETYGC